MPLVFGRLTHAIAGLTNIGAAGARVLYPTGYTASGTALLVGIGSYNQQDPVNIITNIVPPSAVVFESNVATAGISASVQVSAVLSATR